MSDYIDLVKALEGKFPSLVPRELLALLRTAYYGKQWSVDQAPQWADVLPSSPKVEDPRKAAGNGPGTLWYALKSSQVVGNTDVGHVLTGLEALLDPTAAVVIHTSVLDVHVNLTNAEFATWGGDVGQVAAMRLADELTGATMKEPAQYFEANAKASDLEGNLDAFAIQRQAGDLKQALPRPGKKATAAARTVSELLGSYYGVEGPGANEAREHKYSDFVTHQLGGKLANGKIADRMALLRKHAPRVQSFAEVYLMNVLRKREGMGGVAKRSLETLLGDDDWVDILEEYTWDALDRFFDWLDERIAKEIDVP
jgi:hypothetical protein